MCKNIDLCRAHVANFSYALIAVSETWFTLKFTDKMAELNGYNLIRNDRCDRRAGGVALYVLKNYKYKILALSKNTALDFFAEYLACEIELNPKNKLFVAIVYRPPNTPFYKGTNFLKTNNG